MSACNDVTLPKRLMLIVNPVAGRRQYQKHLSDIVSTFMNHGYMVTVFVTQNRNDATRFASMYCGDFDIVVCIGGDGTLSETVAGIAQSGVSVPLGHIPAGSTNVFANSHHLSDHILTAAEDAVTGTAKLIDIGTFDGRYFTYISAFGAFSWLSYTTPQNLKNAIGHPAYILDGVKSLPKIKTEYMRVTTENAAFEDFYIFGAVCNCTSVSGVLSFPEDAVKTDDGMFEVILIREPKTLAEWSAILNSMIRGNYESEMFEFFHTDQVTIETDDQVSWTLDGEYHRSDKLIRIRNVHQAVRLMVGDGNRSGSVGNG